MHRAIRALFVWVMVIAMPLQGMAATGMWFCGPGHERMMHGWVDGTVDDSRDGAPGSATRQADRATHDAAGIDHHAHPHDPSGALAASDLSSEVDADVVGSPLSQTGPSTCSACAACCAAMGLPARFELPVGVGAAHPTLAPLVTPVESQEPDGLDRPPRPALA
jgi:hypothetical protein